jgi:hypothetical protein
MDIKKLALSIITASVFAALSSVPALALSNYTLNGNYVITGDLYVDSLLGHLGQCLEVGTGPLGASEIVATGSPCGGGGGGAVTSVTAGPSGNITAAPTTGAVIVDEIEDPTFTGRVTAFGFIQPDSDKGNPIVSWDDPNDTINLISADASFSVAGISNYEFGISQPSTPLDFLAINSAGTIGVLDLNDANLTPGRCVQSAANGHLISTSSACATGGGGVTSVTAGPSGNLTFAPTTGAVVGDIIENPTFTGYVSTTSATNDFLVGGALGGVSGNFPRAFIATNNINPGGDNTVIGTNSAASASGVSGNTLAIFDYAFSNTGMASFLTLDSTGDLGVAGAIHSGTLTSGNCLQAGTNGVIQNAAGACGSPGGGFPPVQQLHGNQSITAVAAACTPGTPIVFAGTFSAVPDIIMSTSAVVGDTGAPVPGSITTTGFTPEICSVASAATATVYWTAVN